LANIFKEIDRLEKTKLNIRRNTLIDELYYYPLMAAVVCAFLAVLLGQTLLRRNP
jgi:Ca-activated chloride channel family protein